MYASIVEKEKEEEERTRKEERKGKKRSITVLCLLYTYYLPCVTVILAHELSLSQVKNTLRT